MQLIDIEKAVLDQRTVDQLTIIFPLILQISGLIFAVIIDSYLNKKQKRIVLLLSLLVLSLIAQNYIENMLAAGEPRPFYRTIVSMYGYVIRPVILLLFLYIVNPSGRFVASWALVIINAAIYLSTLFSHIAFYISVDNHYQRGPLSKTCLYTSLIMLVYFVYLTIREYGSKRGWEMVIPLFNVVLILGALELDSKVGAAEQTASFLTVAIVSSCVFFYIWMHLQFVREHEKELTNGQRVQIMLSQIKPHFLYNVLGAIEELCESNPRMAKRATVIFSKYLRGNMSSISSAEAIPFEKELSHTKFYLELEQLRFEDALKVSYDISCMDFNIPTLTLEPLVENAVRHGVRGSDDGRGTVTIGTYEYEDRIEISVTDDGPGFDPQQMPADEHSHVGLINVRERLMRVCNGYLRIESALGEGTTATIVLPKGEA